MVEPEHHADSSQAVGRNCFSSTGDRSNLGVSPSKLIAVYCTQDHIELVVLLGFLAGYQDPEGDREAGVLHWDCGAEDRVEPCSVDVELPVGPVRHPICEESEIEFHDRLEGGSRRYPGGSEWSPSDLLQCGQTRTLTGQFCIVTTGMKAKKSARWPLTIALLQRGQVKLWTA